MPEPTRNSDDVAIAEALGGNPEPNDYGGADFHYRELTIRARANDDGELMLELLITPGTAAMVVIKHASRELTGAIANAMMAEGVRIA